MHKTKACELGSGRPQHNYATSEVKRYFSLKEYYFVVNKETEDLRPDCSAALRPGAPRLASRHIGAEDRRVDRARSVLDVVRQQRTCALGVARQRSLHDLLVLAAQAAPRDRAPQHGAVAIALRLVIEQFGET